ncbi:MAG: hypothetical protein N3F09_08670 [Bacteroidia bacterium]|nr:hypothetical protein [Bacteroidia bacterium]
MKKFGEHKQWFDTPENYHEGAETKIKNRVELLSEIKPHGMLYELKLKSAKNFEVPEKYFHDFCFTLNNKISNTKSVKADFISNKRHANQKKSNLIVLYKMAAAIVLVLSGWWVYLSFFKNENATPVSEKKNYADTCQTLACIEREQVLNELYYELSDSEMEAWY